ncbi:hypothetical protein GQ55_5G155200 [Panicum hallii var. hallii]|uniref:Uncharacterized protein n=1 Tax=Panicum hallii var. hallii TaxID=1504633 RepID=A0A2T7DGM2_9POAL|nr:hypothetical protein GQ55_5G155200 [Panicum hallii var. hallii]
MARVGTAHLVIALLLLSAAVCSDSARVLRERPAVLLPAGGGGGQGAVAEMMVPGPGQSSRGAAAVGAGAHESKRLSPGGPDPQHH